MPDINKLAREEIDAVLRKYGLRFSYKFDFPIYRILPVEIQLALKIIEKNKMRIQMIFEPANKDKK